MSFCRFMYQNLITDPGMLSVGSARPGLVGTPAAYAAGSALAYAAGEHQVDRAQVFTVEIDSLASGSQVGQATFRWRRGDDESWQAVGVVTSDRLISLADGVRVKWDSGSGDDFQLGDFWHILASPARGGSLLLDGDRDTGWEALGRADESIEVDLGEESRVRAMILSDHNFSTAALAHLEADPEADWASPEYSVEIAVNRPHLVLFPDISCRYFRVRIQDPSNPGGPLKAGLLYLGDYFQPSRGFRMGYTNSLQAKRKVQATDSGKLSGMSGALSRVWRIGFSGLDSGDAARFEDMYRAIHNPGTGELNPVWFCPFSDTPGETCYCLPPDSLDLSQPHQGRYTLNLTLQEAPRTNDRS